MIVMALQELPASYSGQKLWPLSTRLHIITSYLAAASDHHVFRDMAARCHCVSGSRRFEGM